MIRSQLSKKPQTGPCIVAEDHILEVKIYSLRNEGSSEVNILNDSHATIDVVVTQEFKLSHRDRHFSPNGAREELLPSISPDKVIPGRYHRAPVVASGAHYGCTAFAGCLWWNYPNAYSYGL